MLLGIDVSQFQGAINWPQVRASGVVFGIAKATEGTTWTDADYARNVAGMRAAGIVPGAYHFLIGSVGGAAQCDHFLAVVGDPTGLLVALDVESETNLPDPTLTTVTDFVTRFHSRYPGHPVLIYSGRWFWAGHLGNPDGHTLGPQWNSSYLTLSHLTPLSAIAVPPTWWAPSWGAWSQVSFLQFTDQATVAGISGAIDGDAFAGDMTALLALGGYMDISRLTGAAAVTCRAGGPLYKDDPDTPTATVASWAGGSARMLGTVTRKSDGKLLACFPSTSWTTTPCLAFYPMDLVTIVPDPRIAQLSAELQAAKTALATAQANATGVKTATAALNTAVAKL